jgi:hypothetical protein
METTSVIGTSMILPFDLYFYPLISNWSENECSPTETDNLSFLLLCSPEAYDPPLLFLDTDLFITFPSSNSNAGSSCLNMLNIFYRSFLACIASIVTDNLNLLLFKSNLNF